MLQNTDASEIFPIKTQCLSGCFGMTTAYKLCICNTKTDEAVEHNLKLLQIYIHV